MIPALIPVHQAIHRSAITPSDVTGMTKEQWARIDLSSRVKDQEIAILVGSRGIASLLPVVAASVRAVIEAGGHPFVVPAMGSHGGATAQGQVDVLASLGIDQESIGCPIRATMETSEIGRTSDGLPVRLDRYAADSDGLLVINRIKPHTHFRGAIESGLCKMLALGAGNHVQAQAIHAYGTRSLARLIPEFAAVVLEKGPVIAGLALVEDGGHQLAHLEAIPASEILSEEPRLLDHARSFLASLPLDEIDILIVDKIGKDLSGSGMDTNVIGRVGALDFASFDTPRIGCIVALDLTEATHGNATGVGLADIVTARLDSKIDWNATNANALTAQSPRLAARPVVAPNDRAAIAGAISWCAGPPRPEGPHIVRIANTLELEEVWLSAGALAVAESRGSILSRAKAISLQFSASGELAPLVSEEQSIRS